MLPELKDFTEEELRPDVPKEFASLLPKRFPVDVSARIVNAPACIPNAIRRVICEELPVRALSGKIADMTSDDPNHIYDMILNRLGLIPIDQDTAPGHKITLSATNKTDAVQYVTSEGISRGGRLCNETFPLFTLAPGCSVEINLTVVERYGYEFAGHTLASCCSSTVAGELTGSVSNSQYRNWNLRYTTHGNCDAKIIFNKAIDTIIDRVRAVARAETKRVAGRVYIRLPGESATIGELFKWHLIEAGVTSVRYTTSIVSREITIEIADPEQQAAETTAGVIDDIVEKFHSLKL